MALWWESWKEVNISTLHGLGEFTFCLARMFLERRNLKWQSGRYLLAFEIIGLGRFPRCHDKKIREWETSRTPRFLYTFKLRIYLVIIRILKVLLKYRRDEFILQDALVKEHQIMFSNFMLWKRCHFDQHKYRCGGLKIVE